MSNKTLDKAIEYAGACGILSAVIIELLVIEGLPKNQVAKLLIESIDELDCPPHGIIHLKEKLKQKYKL